MYLDAPRKWLLNPLCAVDMLCAMSEKKDIRGVIFALLGGISWGFSGACGQMLFTYYNADPLWVSSVRMLGAGLVLCAFALVMFRAPLVRLWKTPKSIAYMVVFALAGLAFCQITYLLAIQYSNAGTATVIQYLGPVMIVFYVCFREKRLPTWKEMLALALVVCGTFLIATHGDPANLVISPEALFWCLLSAFAFALYALIPGRLMVSYGSVPVVASALLVGGIVVNLAIQSWNVQPGLDLTGWLVLFVGLVFFGTVVGFTLYFQAVKDIGAAKTSIIAAVETISATMFAVLWLGTAFSWIDIVGFVFIMATVFVLAKPSSFKKPEKKAAPELEG